MNAAQLRQALGAGNIGTINRNLGLYTVLGPDPGAYQARLGSCRILVHFVNPLLTLQGVGAAAACDGLYVPDQVDRCLYAVMPPNVDIVVGGVFTGCGFAFGVGGGNTYFGHVYRAAGSQPEAQKASFEEAINGVVSEFNTTGRVTAPGAARGYVFGTKVQGAWRYHWV